MSRGELSHNDIYGYLYMIRELTTEMLWERFGNGRLRSDWHSACTNLRPNVSKMIK